MRFCCKCCSTAPGLRAECGSEAIRNVGKPPGKARVEDYFTGPKPEL